MNHRFATIVWRWLPLIVWMAAIFYLSDQQKQDIPAFGTWDLLIKKGSHFSAYVVHVSACPARNTQPLLALLLAVAFAASDEYHQSFVPGRHGTVVDVLIDSVGALTCASHATVVARNANRPMVDARFDNLNATNLRYPPD